MLKEKYIIFFFFKKANFVIIEVRILSMVTNKALCMRCSRLYVLVSSVTCLNYEPLVKSVNPSLLLQSKLLCWGL